jgi:hypothetical protein
VEGQTGAFLWDAPVLLFVSDREFDLLVGVVHPEQGLARFLRQTKPKGPQLPFADLLGISRRSR